MDLMISEEEIKQVAETFDKIRVLHTKTDPSKDNSLLQNFQQKVGITVSQISSDPSTENVINAKMQLWEYCWEILGTHVEIENPDIYSILKTIFYHFSTNFQSIQNRTIRLEDEISQLNETVAKNKKEVEDVLAAAEALEFRTQELTQERDLLANELEKARDELANQLEHLQDENKVYLDKIISLSKQAADNSVRNSSNSPGRKDIIPRQLSKKVIMKSRMSISKDLTLKQLKETIEDIYANKLKFDEKCKETKLARETMEQYLYTYLNQKYGLKSLINEWFQSISKAIERYQEFDAEIALFSKILKHHVDEEFRDVFVQLRESIKQLLKSFLQTKYPYIREPQLNITIKEKTQNTLEEDEWKHIVNSIFSHDEAEYVIAQINEIVKQKANSIIMTSRRARTQQTRPEASYIEVVNCILFYDLTAHEALLAAFNEKFSKVDTDKNGLLNDDEFRALVASFDLLNQSDRLLDTVDPLAIGIINYSDCLNLFSIEPYPDQDKQISVLHYLYYQYQKLS